MNTPEALSFNKVSPPAISTEALQLHPPAYLTLYSDDFPEKGRLLERL